MRSLGFGFSESVGKAMATEDHGEKLSQDYFDVRLEFAKCTLNLDLKLYCIRCILSFLSFVTRNDTISSSTLEILKLFRCGQSSSNTAQFSSSS
jgi:hypothetical protein